MRTTILIAAAALFSTNANAQNQCADYLGQTIAPKTFDEAIMSFANLAPKGEFETTAQYEDRKKSALAGILGPLLISKAPEDRKYFQYDADAQKLRIITYAFQNTFFDTPSAFFVAGSKIDASTLENIQVVISRVDQPTGSYVAQNGFGASARVISVKRTTAVIFDRKANFGEPLFPTAKGSPYVVGELTLVPAEAQALKPNLKLAFVVVPREPYLIRGSKPGSVTTIQNPIDVTENFSILIADIQCGLVTDSTNKVLAAYPTSSSGISPGATVPGQPQNSAPHDSGPLASLLPAGPPSTPPTPTTSHAITADDYPTISIRLQEQGTVKVRYLVKEDGTVGDCSVTMSSGKSRLDDAACTMVRRRWRFKPATRDGHPVAEYLTDDVSFRLQ